jgi:hypothetical protein
MEFKDVPKPYKRYYDDKRRKRRLFIEITSWQGLSVGAVHYYAEIREDDNAIMQDDHLIYYGDDEDRKGRSFGGVMDAETSFNTLEGAKAWVVNKILKEFPNHMVDEVSGSYVTLNEIKKELKEAREDETIFRKKGKNENKKN